MSLGTTDAAVHVLQLGRTEARKTAPKLRVFEPVYLVFVLNVSYEVWRVPQFIRLTGSEGM